MKEEEDVRAEALADQLRVIDQRVLAAGNWRSTWMQRSLLYLSIGLLMASLHRSGSHLIVPIAGWLVLSLSVDPLIRVFMRRRAEGERARLVRLCEEVDRRVALLTEDAKGEGS